MQLRFRNDDECKTLQVAQGVSHVRNTFSQLAMYPLEMINVSGNPTWEPACDLPRFCSLQSLKKMSVKKISTIKKEKKTVSIRPWIARREERGSF